MGPLLFLLLLLLRAVAPTPREIPLKTPLTGEADNGTLQSSVGADRQDKKLYYESTPFESNRVQNQEQGGDYQMPPSFSDSTIYSNPIQINPGRKESVKPLSKPILTAPMAPKEPEVSNPPKKIPLEDPLKNGPDEEQVETPQKIFDLTEVKPTTSPTTSDPSILQSLLNKAFKEQHNITSILPSYSSLWNTSPEDPNTEKPSSLSFLDPFSLKSLLPSKIWLIPLAFSALSLLALIAYVYYYTSSIFKSYSPLLSILPIPPSPFGIPGNLEFTVLKALYDSKAFL